MKNATIPERERLTCHVRDELQNFASMSSKSDIKPMNVQKRLSEDALYRKYMTMPDAVDYDTSNSRGHSSRNSLSDEPKTEKTDSVISEQISSVSGSDEEKVEILVTPEDVHHTEQRVYNGPRQTVSAAMTQPPPLVPLTQTNRSLLKPMYQRIIEENDANGICVVRPEIGLTKKLEEPKVKQVPKPSAAPQPKPQSQPPQQPATISLFRQRLSAALNKAKDEQQTMHNRIQTESPDTVSSSSPITQALTVKCNSTTSSSSPPQSSKCSPSSIEMDSLNQNEIDPSEMEQANFLRLFGLCTPAYTQYLMNRRPQRKKRTCTSTERTDFHYKFELFEKQFSKRNKRHFLYSPPATRAKRRIASNGINSLAKEVITTAAKKRTKGIKSNASSSSSISSSGSSNYTEKVCVTCYKQSKNRFDFHSYQNNSTTFSRNRNN